MMVVDKIHNKQLISIHQSISINTVDSTYLLVGPQ